MLFPSTLATSRHALELWPFPCALSALKGVHLRPQGGGEHIGIEFVKTSLFGAAATSEPQVRCKLWLQDRLGEERYVNITQRYTVTQWCNVTLWCNVTQ
jgi:hypothetical protein